MEKLNTLLYPVLQGLAKKHGIKANLKREELIAELTKVFEAKSTTKKEEDNSTITETSSWANITGGNRKENTDYNNAQMYPMSDGMRKWVLDLAKRHRFTDEQITEMASWSKQKASEFIEEYQYKPMPASDKQIELITQTVTEIRETASRPNMPEEVAKYAKFNVPEAVIAQLTGGREGTAGTLIDKLFAINKELRPYRALSEKQADMIVPWFLCPDVPFEDYGVEKKIGNRLMTPVEFKVEIMAKFTASDASFFIDQYMPVVRQWERTRITEAQIKHIREIESRMADLSVGIKKEWAYDPETGNVIEVVEKRERQYNPIAYEMLPEENLRQMSREDANKYITQLKIELAQPTKGSIDNSQAQQMLEDKRNRTGEVDEYQAVVDFTYKLDAVCAFTNDELREEITELIVHGNGQTKDVMAQLVDYIDLAIDTHGIGFKNLVDMAGESALISELLEMNYPDEYNEAIGGTKSENTTPQQKKEQAVDNAVEDFLNSL